MFGLRVIAVLEIIKGITVLCIVLGFHSLVTYHSQVELIQKILAFMKHVHPHELSLILGLAVCYSFLHIIEGFGLWYRKNWARWITILSTAIYLPFEFYEIFQGLTFFKSILILTNLAVLFYVVSIRKKMN